MRKGQITLFIIIGLIIVLSAALFIFLREKEIIFQPEIITPTETEPIKRYIDTCVFNLALEAIETIGIQGGYLEVPRDIQAERTSYLDYGYGIYKIPYWYYEGETRIPTFDFIAEELATYVQENLQGCTDGFKPFLGQYEITEEKPKVDITFNEGYMIFTIDYPLKIDDRYENKRTRLRDFSVNVQADLKGAYDLANRTMYAELEKTLIENLTLEMMTSDMDHFPFTGMQFTCDRNQWMVPELRTRLMALVEANLPRVRVKHTDYPPFEREEEFYEGFREYTFMDAMEAQGGGGTLPIDVSESVSDWYEYFKMFYDVDSQTPDLRIAFIYQPEWGMEMVVQPSEGDRLVPRSFPGSGLLSYMCFQIYHYTYNVRYPVLVRIIDPEAFLGKGFTFQFAFPAQIMNNEGRHDVFRVADFEGYRTMVDFCDPIDNFGTDIYTITAKGMDEDGYPDQPIHDVNISYRCLNRICDGMTMTGFGGKAETRLPDGCGNPTLIGKKDGYMDGYATVTGTQVTIPMDRLREFNVTVVKYVYESVSGSFIGTEALEPYENATFFIEKLDRRQDQVIAWPPFDPEVQQPLTLREEGGEYRVEAVLYRKGLDDLEVVGGYFARNITFNYGYFGESKDVILPVIDYRPQPASDEDGYVMWTFLSAESYNETVRPVFT